MKPENSFSEKCEKRGVTRREFLKFCSVVAGAMGLGPAFGPRIAEVFASGSRPPVLWLHFAECTGCTESALRTVSPGFGELILDTISLDYHETLMAAAGDTVEEILAQGSAGAFLCIVEGAIPTAENGIYGMVGGRTMLSIAQDVCPKAQAIIALGTCASYGGLPAAAPNLTGAKGVKDALGAGLGVPLINIPGCPPNPVNLVGTIANYLLFGQQPELDDFGRPLFAYGNKVHSQCPYRERNESKCLEDFGCKGKQCFNNCPSVKFNDATSWPVLAGHPCIGCSEPGFWDTMTPFYRESDEDDDDREEDGENRNRKEKHD